MPAPSSSPPACAPPHLLIPFAACSTEAWLPAMQALPRDSTRHLGELLRGMKQVHADMGEAYSLSPPHERVLGRAQGLLAAGTPDGLIAWAARDAAEHLHDLGNKAWAWITPCHWAMGREHATLTDPAALALREDESRALLAAMQPYFETDGITLHYLEPERWLAEGELFRTLPTASLDRVLGRNVDAWLPGAKGVVAEEFSAGPPQGKLAPSGGSVLHEVKSVGAKTLRRLQNEMQMLLYTHPLNDERAARRQLPVNSFWLSGTGALPSLPAPGVNDQVSVPRGLAQAAFHDDWAAYAQAWAALDAGEIAGLLTRQRMGESVRLTLCGERSAHTYESSRPGLLARISSLFTPALPVEVLKQL
ncbi:hypothetical protein [Polaromonas sp. JS666]|uniref:hypothetical protein n=1 Tax=Polaromonas sp. (strain JS666 / ATCC BAA-500) TaxID=296591 RepID=UPI000053371E|nr:hypothetical protein [Polaromonas sp. JS666]ABE42967.1 conserved hypothetical protein [Polaromonas sp. JS666]